jgi:ribosomal protein S18 acetylase RimI-like enzyme
MMMIRALFLDESAALSELAIATYVDAFGHSMQPADLAAHIQGQLTPAHFASMLARDVVLGVEIAGRLAGFIQFGLAHDALASGASRDQELRRLYVRAEFQQRGIGSALIEQALAHPDLRQAARIFLDVWEHNHGARRFYQRYGFTVIEQRAFVVESGAETSYDLIMVRYAA